MRRSRIDKLVLVTQRATLLPATLSVWHDAAHRAKGLRTARMAMFSSNPLESIITVTWLRWLLTVMLLVLIPQATYRVYGGHKAGLLPSFLHYRFTNLESRNGDLAPSTPGISLLGILETGEQLGACKAGITRDSNMTVRGATVTLSLDPEEARRYGKDLHAGWFIVTQSQEGTQQSDSVRFILEGSDDGVVWEKVGSSTWQNYYLTVRLTPDAGRAPTPEERDTPLVRDMRITWPHFLGKGIAAVEFYCFMMATVLLAHMDKLGSLKRLGLSTVNLIRVNTVILSLLQFASGIGHLRLSHDTASLSPINEPSQVTHTMAISFCWFITAALLGVLQPIFEVVLFVAGWWFISFQLHLHWELFGYADSLLQMDGDTLAIFWPVAGVVIFAVRCTVMRKAVEGLACTKAQYFAVWRQMLVDNGEALEYLAVVVDKIRIGLEGKVARQLGVVDRVAIQNLLDRKPSLPVKENLRSTRESQGTLRHSNRRVSHTASSDDSGMHSSQKAFFRASVSPDSSPISFPDKNGRRPARQRASVTDSTLSMNDQRADNRWEYVAKNVIQNDLLQQVFAMSAGKLPRGNPIKSCDHLHAQAFLLHDIFCDFVFELAVPHNGKCRVRRGTRENPAKAGFAGWHDELPDGHWMQPCGVKSVRRMIDKADVAYGGDVSRMLDLCRQSVYFESVSDLTSYLAALSNDPCIEIVRIKNKMSPLCDSSNDDFLFSGYRFVSVNCRIRTFESAALCVSSHVCELLLVPIPIASIQFSLSAYHEWRKCVRSLAFFKRVSSFLRLGRSKSSLNGNESRVADRLVPDQSAPSSSRTTTSQNSSPGSPLRSPVGPVKSPHGARPRKRRDISPVRGDSSPVRGDSSPVRGDSSPVRGDSSPVRTLEPSPLSNVSGLAGELRSLLPISHSLTDRVRSHSGVSLGNFSVHTVDPDMVSGSSLRLSSGYLEPLDTLLTLRSDDEEEATLVAAVKEPKLPLHRRRSWASMPCDVSGGLFKGIIQSGALGSPSMNGDDEKRFESSGSGSCGRSQHESGPGTPLKIRKKYSKRFNSIELEAPGMAGFAGSGVLRRTESDLPRGASVHNRHESPGQEVTSWGLKLDGDLVDAIEALCRMAAMGLGDFIDYHWKTMQNTAFETSSLSSLFFSRRPITSASYRWPFRTFIFVWWVISVVMSILGSFSYYSSINNEIMGPFTHYRMTTMVTRDGTTGGSVLEPGVQDFGVLTRFSGRTCTPRGSIAIDATSPTKEVHGTSIIETFETPMGMSGWYLVSSPTLGSEGKDPSYFEVWGTNHDFNVTGGCADGSAMRDVTYHREETEWCGVTWHKVGAPSWRYRMLDHLRSSRPSIIDFSRLHSPSIYKRSRAQTYILFPPVDSLLLLTIPHILRAIPLGAAVFLSMTGGRLFCWQFDFYAHLCLGAANAAVVVPFVWAFIQNVVSSRWLLAVECSLSVPSLLVWAYGVWYEGPLLIYYILVGGLLYFVPFSIFFGYAFGDLFRDQAITGLVFMGLFCSLVFFRRRDLWRSRNLVRKDKERYDELWEKLTQDEDSRFCIEHLEKVVRMIGLDDQNYCMHNNRANVDTRSPPGTRKKRISIQIAPDDVRHYPLFKEMGVHPIPGRADRHSLVNSFDQLYAQAAVANLLLIERCKVWALRTEGYVPTFDGQKKGFAKLKDVENDPVLSSQILWSSLKKHGRAFEKLLRVYGNEPARLLDVTRNLLVFDTMTDLTNCLGNIVTDESVRVERLKNRMRMTYDSSETGGYRDVCINLRFMSKAAFALGAELHICEVQLLLRDFADLRSAEGHTRYVQARNTRGV